MKMIQLKSTNEDLFVYPEPYSREKQQKEGYRYQLNGRSVTGLLAGSGFNSPASVSGYRFLCQEPPTAYRSRYLDPRGDFAFKYIFGKEAHKGLLIDFLNSVFEDREVIRDVQMNPTEHPGRKKGTRKVLFDLLCTTDKGEQILVEMQREHQDFFTGRALYYAQRIGSEQVPAGKAGDDYRLRDVYVIAILDFNLWDDPSQPLYQREEYMSVYNLRRVGTGDLHPENIELRYIELPKFIKEAGELRSRLEKWLYLLRNLHCLQGPIFRDDPIFRKLFEITEIKNLKEEDRMLIDHERDWRNKIKSGKRKGMRSGLEKGLRKGRMEGRMEGIDIGAKQEKLTFIRTLIRDTAFDDRKIANLAAVEEDFVRKIRGK